jgi:hypothetical protein
LLFLALPLPAAFGLHFALAAALGYLGARRYARAEGASREAAEAAALAFAGSGVFVSAWTIYNAGMALAMGSWVAAAAVKLARRVGEGDRDGTRRSVAGLGVAGALCVLAGEPVIALLVAVFCAVRLAASYAAKRPGPRPPLDRALASALGAGVLAALLAAPLLLTTWQAARGTSRDLARYAFEGATATSVHPARLVEQAMPFPFGRPDFMEDHPAFDGHRYFQGTAPYLWTLHLGWVPLLLLVAFGGARTAGERTGWILAGSALVLSLGSYLPGASALYPILSLGGRIRYPVKWWYVVALALVPLLAGAIDRWGKGAAAARPRRLAALALLTSLLVAGGRHAEWLHPWRFGFLATAALAGIVFLATLRTGARRASVVLLACIGVPALASVAPLLHAVVDRPARSIEPPGPGRLYERVQVPAHAPPSSSPPGVPAPTRDFFRRVQREGWALTGALSGIPYAFDADPDGSYSYHDRIVREAVDSVGWPERAAELRLAGVTHVLAREALPGPYEERGVLGGGVRLYELPGAVPSVRRVGRIFRAPHFNATVEIHRSAVFDPATDVVLPGRESVVEGSREAGRVHLESESTDRLVAEIDGVEAGVVVWSRTYFPAWRARVDGVDARVLAADGHLVGVAVPAGPHRVEIVWPRRPLLLGAALSVLGVFLAVVLVRSPVPRL